MTAVPAVLPNALQARLAPATLLGGIGCGIATIAAYQWTWGLVLAAAVTVLTAIALPAGWGTRLPFAFGNTLVVATASVPRGEGDYLLAASTPGYVVLVLTLVLVVYSLALIPRPRRTRSETDTPAPDSPAP